MKAYDLGGSLHITNKLKSPLGLTFNKTLKTVSYEVNLSLQCSHVEVLLNSKFWPTVALIIRIGLAWHHSRHFFLIIYETQNVQRLVAFPRSERELFVKYGFECYQISNSSRNHIPFLVKIEISSLICKSNDSPRLTLFGIAL